MEHESSEENLDAVDVHAVNLDPLGELALCGEHEWTLVTDNSAAVTCAHCRYLLKLPPSAREQVERAA